MPNNIHNRLVLEGNQDEVKKVMDFLKADHICKGDDTARVIDFNNIIPMPPRYAETDEYGYYVNEGWYDWSIKNWGTKFNAYSTYIDEEMPNAIHFDTAYVSVPELIKKVAQKFPNVKFIYAFADKDNKGAEVGIFNIKGNEGTWTIFPNFSKDAIELGMEIGAIPKDAFVLRNGEYFEVTD